MMHLNALVYDLEIVRAIPPRSGPREEGIEYCDGWHDHANMGISVLCAYDCAEDRYRVFTKANCREFRDLILARQPLLVGFNNIAFDNQVLRACWGFAIDADADSTQCFDLLVELWKGAHLGPKFEYPSHTGFGLDAVCRVNIGEAKTGNGAIAPVQWQRGEIGAVIDYCLADVRLTKRLFEHIVTHGYVRDPRDPHNVLDIAGPNWDRMRILR